MGAAVGGAPGKGESWCFSGKGQFFGPLHPATRVQKLLFLPQTTAGAALTALFDLV